MNTPKGTNRRQFMKKAAGAAGAVMLSGVGCAEDESNVARPPDAGKQDAAVSEPLVSREDTVLFSEGSTGAMRLKNRIVRAATDDFYAVEGVATKKHHALMTELAGGGAGLIISGMMCIWEPVIIMQERRAYTPIMDC